MTGENYVYKHQSPETGEVVYVGRGTGQRAWMVQTHRSKDHEKWLKDMLQDGVTMQDVVTIIRSGLNKQDAKDLEEAWVRGQKPIFNFHFNTDDRNRKIKKEDILRLQTLRQSGLSYKAIGKLENTTAMPVWRALNAR